MKVKFGPGLIGLLLSVGVLGSCGSQEIKSDVVSTLSSNGSSPERFALVADSLATGLFADSTFSQEPKRRGENYGKFRTLLALVGTFKGLLQYKFAAFRLLQIQSDMNLLFGSLTNPGQSLYHKLASSRGDGSQIVAESAIIASKVMPFSYVKHIQNYTQWPTTDFTSIIFALGSNDICNSWQTADQFERNYREALRHVTSVYPNRNLYIITPPFIPRLADGEIREAPVFGLTNLQCKDYFEILTCPTYRDQDRFEDFIARIRKVAGEFSGAQFIDISHEPIGLEDLSGDCFHPTHAGHDRFAQKLAPYFAKKFDTVN
jgi:lysophospholipase L1-like esterase